VGGDPGVTRRLGLDARLANRLNIRIFHRTGWGVMGTSEKLSRAAETDRTFSRRGADWVGKCLICNGPIAFDARTGEGATLEHIRARGRGGSEAIENLAAVHARCNWEKGRRWDPKRRRDPDEYDDFIARLLTRRLERWREPTSNLNKEND
jgi:5-methylcytosine-specific restriction endonuclease McrA